MTKHTGGIIEPPTEPDNVPVIIDPEYGMQIMTTEELIIRQSGLLGRARQLADAVENDVIFIKGIASELKKDITILFDELQKVIDDGE